MRSVTLELGGKSSAIVLPDADLDAMSAVLIRSCLSNTGQTCYISSRIIAPASRNEYAVGALSDDWNADWSADEAIALANNAEFGLGGTVFGGDEDQALEVARRVDSGSVGINFFGSNHAAPFGGRHDSGMGVEYGVEGLNAYLSYKSIHRKTAS